MAVRDHERERMHVEVKTTRVRPRGFQIRKEDGERLGFSRGCGGCSSWFKGRSRQPHTEECRARFRKLLADEARVRFAAEKRREFDEKMKENAKNKIARKTDKQEEGGWTQVGGSSSSASGMRSPGPTVRPTGDGLGSPGMEGGPWRRRWLEV